MPGRVRTSGTVGARHARIGPRPAGRSILLVLFVEDHRAEPIVLLLEAVVEALQILDRSVDLFWSVVRLAHHWL
jgi:hypothetical protein